MELKLSLHFNSTTKVAYVKDDTVYSLPPAAKKYVFGSLNYPNGLSVFSRNDISNPLINFNADPRVSENFSLGSTIQAGNYSFSSKVFIEWINQDSDIPVLFSSTNTLSIIGVDLTDILKPGELLTPYNCTNPANDSSGGTIESVEYVNNSTRVTFMLSNIVPDPNPDTQAIININRNYYPNVDTIYNYSTCSKTLCPELDFTYDAFSTQYGSATLSDNTNYYGWNITSKNLQLFYPAGLNPLPAENPISTPLANITINELATGIYTCKLAVTANYVQNDGLVIDVTSTKIKQATVIAYTEMCGIQGCINKMLDRHTSYLKSAKISPLQQYVDQVYGLYINAKEALACGDRGTYSNYVSQIYTIFGTTEDSCDSCSCGGSCGGSCDSCSDSCGCGQPDEPVWINNLGIDVDSLLGDFENFMNNQLPDLLDTVSSLETTVTDEVLPAISSIQTELAAIGPQTNTNTGDITGLQSQVDTLNGEVATLQEQIATFSPSNSEVALNELLTNDGSNPLLFTAASGDPAAGNENLAYVVNLIGNQSSYLSNGAYVTFYSPADSAWYQGTIASSEYKGGPNQTMITIDSIVGSDTYWTSNSTPFPFFLAKPLTSIYNFTKQFNLENANYWKLEDSSNKYWAKLKTSFLWNGTNLGLNSMKIVNEATGEELELRGINPGSMVDLELTFEKLWNGSAYDLVYMLDFKSTTSENSNIVEGVLSNAGFTGYNPKENSDLYQNTSRQAVVSPNVGGGTPGIFNMTQDVYNTLGNQNTNRVISRYASGPSYPNNTSSQFFTGGNDTIFFNNDNGNMTILNFEVSYGKMPA